MVVQSVAAGEDVRELAASPARNGALISDPPQRHDPHLATELFSCVESGRMHVPSKSSAAVTYLLAEPRIIYRD